jgi:HD superfamily phosphohydrolase
MSTNVLTQAHQIQRDRDDLGIVLAALKRRSEDPDEPSQLLDRYIGADLKFKSHFQFDLASFRLACEVGVNVKCGGSAIVLCCTNRAQPLVKYALKMPRPSNFNSQSATKDLAREFQRSKAEYVKHAPLSHKNIAQLFAQERVNVHLADMLLSLPALLVEWVEGARELVEYLSEARLRWPEVVEILIQVFEALDHLHSKDLVHWDLKSENFLVNDTAVPKLLDIGNARNISKEKEKSAFSTIWNIPPELKKRHPPIGSALGGSRRTEIPLGNDTSWDCPWLDLWMLGRELNRLFRAEIASVDLDAPAFPRRQWYAEASERFLRATFPSGDGEAEYALSYIRLILKRLLHPSLPTAAQYYRSASRLQHRDASEVVHDLRKLQSEFGASQNVAELQAIPQHVLRLPCSGNVPLTPRVRHFLNTGMVRRLANHLQLGFLGQIYPAATHRRSEHLFGVLAAVTQYVRALFADRSNPFWRISIEHHDVDTLLTAALLHDVGHLAFGHVLEEMEALFRGRMHEDYALEVLAGKPQPGVQPSPTAPPDRDELCRILQDTSGVASGLDTDEFLADVAEILSRPPDSTAVAEQTAELEYHKSRQLKLQILHSIIEGPIDADKLDYLIRDAHHCGVAYPNGIDSDRFFQALTCITHLSMPSTSASRAAMPNDTAQSQSPHACIGITDKGLLPAETLFLTRYHMFSSVYWHHTHRAFTATLQFCVQEYLGTDEATATPRLEELTNNFRDKPDYIALDWLRSKIESMISSGDKRNLMLDACDGLMGDRRKLYRRYFELRYDSREQLLHTSHRKSLSAKLMEDWDYMNRAKVPHEYVHLVRVLRQNVTRRLATKLKNKVQFLDGEILIDIPPKGKDQIEHVYVLYDGTPIPIQQMSPVADAVRDAFTYWVRKVRVFVAPSAQQKFASAGIADSLVREACESVMYDMVADPSQASLFDEEGE